MSDNKAKLQTIFDRVVSHLLKQGKPSIGNGGCAYYVVRGENLRCAIGAAVKKDVARHLESHFPGLGIVVGIDGEKERELNEFVCKALDLEMTDENVGFLAELQDMHDGCQDEDGFCDAILVDAKRITGEYGLSFSYGGLW